MSRAEQWAIAGLAALATLTLGLADMTAVTYRQIMAPLPTKLSLADMPAQPTGAAEGLTPVGLARLTPLRRAATPQATIEPPGNGAAVVNAAPPGPTTYPESGYKFLLGQSSQGRDITGIALPATDSPVGLVLVSGIHGDEVNAWPALQRLLQDYQSRALAQPARLSLYFVPSLNPDGAAADRRLNANDIDLNRNWDTYDWRTGIEISPVDYLPRGGGTRPFSEPETRAMRDLLLTLGSVHPGGLTVLYFHAAAPPNGLVTPGSHRVDGQELADAPSRELGQALATATGYDYSNTWVGDYSVTGDASTWAVAQGFRSLTIELPTRGDLAPDAANRLYTGLLAVIQYLAAH